MIENIADDVTGKAIRKSSAKVVLTLFAIFFVSFYFFNIKVYLHDANYYWTIADGMFADGKFNLFGFPETFRGCIYPTILSAIKRLSSAMFGAEHIGYGLFASLLMAVFMGIVLPHYFDVQFDRKERKLYPYISLTMVALCTLYFWGGTIFYPLSDMPALAFFGIGTVAMDCAGSSHRKATWVLLGILGGGCLYAAYNTRVVYLYGIAAFVLWFIITKRNDKAALLVVLGAALVGAGILSIPQILINWHYTGEITPRVLTEQMFNYDSTLQSTQVYWGLSYSRYETYVGNSMDYPSASVSYFDPIGLNILNREAITAENFSFLTLLRLALKYPMDLCGIYGRHLVSLLVPFYRDAYVGDLFVSKSIRIFSAVLLWFLIGLSLVCGKENEDKNLINKNSILIISCLIPALLQFFGAPEIRFFISVHLVAYFWLWCCVDWKRVGSVVKQHLILSALSLGVVFALCTSVAGNILWQTNMSPMIIGDSRKQYIDVEEIYSEEEMVLSDTDMQVGVDVLRTEDGVPVKIQSNTFYRISFEMDQPIESTELLYFDFYGTNYDNAAQDFQFEFNKSIREYSLMCDSGTVPEDAVVRMVFVTDHQNIIRNFKLTVVEAK